MCCSRRSTRITLGCVYALIAIGFTLVYGITRVINFAFGELYMLGAFATYLASIVVANYFGSVGIAAVLLVAAPAPAVIMARRRLGDGQARLPAACAACATTVALIAAIGLSISHQG